MHMHAIILEMIPTSIDYDFHINEIWGMFNQATIKRVFPQACQTTPLVEFDIPQIINPDPKEHGFLQIL